MSFFSNETTDVAIQDHSLYVRLFFFSFFFFSTWMRCYLLTYVIRYPAREKASSHKKMQPLFLYSVTVNNL